MIKRTIPLVLAAALATVSVAAAAHVIEMQARLGHWVQLAPGVAVEPLRVIEDSRCPQDVTCVWAGRFVLAARVRDHGRVQSVKLTLGVPQKIGRGRVTLDQVTPERAGKRINGQQYRFGLSYAPQPPQPGEMQPMLERQ